MISYRWHVCPIISYWQDIVPEYILMKIYTYHDSTQNIAFGEEKQLTLIYWRTFLLHSLHILSFQRRGRTCSPCTNATPKLHKFRFLVQYMNSVSKHPWKYPLCLKVRLAFVTSLLQMLNTNIKKLLSTAKGIYFSLILIKLSFIG